MAEICNIASTTAGEIEMMIVKNLGTEMKLRRGFHLFLWVLFPRAFSFDHDHVSFLMNGIFFSGGKRNVKMASRDASSNCIVKYTPYVHFKRDFFYFVRIF